MTDIVEWLESPSIHSREYLESLCHDSATVIKRLREDKAKLRAALREIRDAGPMTLDDQRWRIALAALGGET